MPRAGYRGPQALPRASYGRSYLLPSQTKNSKGKRSGVANSAARSLGGKKDKLLRGLYDGIGQSQVIWGDDSQVVQTKAAKVYGTDFLGAEVKITEL